MRKWFSLFHTVFSKIHCFWIVKSRECVVKELILDHMANFTLVQFENICRRQNKCRSNDDICLAVVENIVRKGKNGGC